ncbi:MAG: hypothetical protein M3Q55_02540, partial [Acidobacteriota bacterium]|nr:hypothetical protein [Acidobacteriota bacterium]
MCGIFGFVSPQGRTLEHARAQSAIRSLIALSEPRGREATGVAVMRAGDVAVYRRPMAPERVLAHPGFQRFLDESLPRTSAPDTAGLAVLGHCRLVTNGTQILDQNNQPVLLDDVVGVHNGIVTNTAAMGARSAAPRAGSRAEDAELDSAVLFRYIETVLASGAAVSDALARTYGVMEGEASIAMLAPSRNALALATNTGSLYYAGGEADGLLVFASEAHILRALLAKGEIGRADLTVAQLAPGRALTIDAATARATASTLPPTVYRGRGTQHRARSTSTEHQAPSTEHPAPPLAPRIIDRTHAPAAVRRCTRCILPSTYPFITFDTDGVCSHCHEHETQKVAGREALMKAL